MAVSYCSNSTSLASLPRTGEIRQGEMNKRLFFFQPEVNVTHGQLSCLISRKLMKAKLPFLRISYLVNMQFL